MIVERIDPDIARDYINIFYEDDFSAGEITSGEREFCLELLQSAGFHCVSGYAGSPEEIVGEMAERARGESLAVINAKKTDDYFVGPNPAVESGIGIWAAGE